MRDIDWEKYANRQYDSPLTIDFENSNIHEEFLEIEVEVSQFRDAE